jgi:hypothetical protein
MAVATHHLQPRPWGIRVRSALAPELEPLRRIAEDSLARTLLVALILAQLLDVLTTAVLLDGHHTEANPLSGMVIAAFGFPGLLLSKSVLTLWIAGYSGASERGTCRLLLGASALLGFAVVAWNMAPLLLPGAR